MHKVSYSLLKGLYNLVNKYELVSLFNKYTDKVLKINKMMESIIQNKK